MTEELINAVGVLAEKEHRPRWAVLLISQILFAEKSVAFCKTL